MKILVTDAFRQIRIELTRALRPGVTSFQDRLVADAGERPAILTS
jgi:hypothetical protein